MGIWQRLRGVEKRQAGGSSYTDALVSWLQSRAGGSSALPGATAAAEAASSFVSRAFASADVSTDDSIKGAALDPHTLAMIGRALIRGGEYVAAIMVESGTLRLSPAASFDVVGGDDPETWVYRLSLAGPTRQTTFENVPGAGVVHIRYSSDTQPWRGIGPLQAAHLAGRLSAEVSSALADELSGPRGQLLPIPNVDGEDPAILSLKADLRGLKGQLAFVESMADSFGTGPQNNAASGWESKRVGADIPVASIQAAKLAFGEVVAACGLSVALWDDSQGTGKRESYRQALHSVIAPLGRIVSAELSAKLETSIRLDWQELRAGDISGRSRAFQSLVNGGMAVEKAAALAGLMVADE